ncbi:amino acid ABC transporter permease [Candidatus Sumerlaeota bacterium]|nr:amino acid ABC transporter permease [Candidatus Sumerlaeota bacterium]
MTRSSARSGCSEAAWWTVFIATAIAICAMLFLYNGDAGNPFPSIFRRTLDGRIPDQSIMESAIITTVLVIMGGLILSLVVGIFIAIFQLSRFTSLRFLGAVYVETFRGLPIYVTLLFVYFGVRALLKALPLPFEIPGITADEAPFSISLSPFVSAIIALGCCYGAYMSEVVRAGISAIPPEEIEAASLEAGRAQVYLHVIFPQALRIILPALVNECIALTKDSSLVGAITLIDITRSADIYARSTFLYFETFSALALMYLFISLLLSRLQRTLEGVFRKDRLVVAPAPRTT